MKYYFLLEDEKSFIKVLPKWLQYMGFPNKRVADIREVTECCYVMQSGQGVTQLITRALFQTIDTIQQHKGTIDELIIILDSENHDVAYRKNEVTQKIDNYIQKNNLDINFTYKIFVCNHCFETWLLGNRELYPNVEPSKDNDFSQYYKHYNVKENDPEELKQPESIKETIAAYHFHYFHEMCRYNKIRYNKKKPDIAATEEFFHELKDRINYTSHLNSFREFYNYFSMDKA